MMAGYCSDHQQREPCQVCAQDADQVQVQLQPARDHSAVRVPVTDRDMWVLIRSAVLGMVAALDDHGPGGPLQVALRSSLLAISSAIELRWNIKRRQPRL